MAKTAAARARGRADPARRRVLGWLADHPGATANDVTRGLAPMTLRAASLLLLQTVQYGEATRVRKPAGTWRYTVVAGRQ